MTRHPAPYRDGSAPCPSCGAPRDARASRCRPCSVKRSRRAPDLDDLLARTTLDPDTGCRLWTGATSDGYGAVTRSGRRYRVHRLTYALAHGLTLDDLDGLVVRHACDRPACIAPEHLDAGTQADNLADMARRGRGRKRVSS